MVAASPTVIHAPFSHKWKHCTACIGDIYISVPFSNYLEKNFA